MKRNLILAGLITATIVLAVFSVATAMRVKNLGTEPVVPSVPKSKPQAVDKDVPVEGAVPAAGCRASFAVPTPTVTGTVAPSSTPTLTPTPTPALTSTPTPTNTPTGVPTVTNTPGPTATPLLTNTPVPTTPVTAGPTPTEVKLPQAGLKVPTLGGLIMGFLLISLGAALVF